ncbi:myosin heavy chain-related protein [Tanacetum coccineum]
MTVTRAREIVGSQVVQQTRIQCFNCKEFGHFAKECKKPKRVKDYMYHKEKMLLCKQAEKECDDAHVVLAKLIANLTLDTEVNKNILKQLKKENASLTQELKECKSNLEESNTTRDSCLIALQSKQTELEMYKTLIDRTVDYDKPERLVKEKTKVITDLKFKEEKDIEKMISMGKQLKFLNEIVYKRNQSIQTIHMLAPKGSTFNGRPTFANLMYLKKAQSKKPCLYEIPYDISDPANRFILDREETLTLEKES